MAVSDVSICNLALTMLSTGRISSLTEDSENARRCNAIYESTRDALLAEHNWNFARAERTASASTNEVVLLDNWTEVHQIPNDCLRIIRVENDYPFSVYEDKIFSNVETLRIEYIKKITDPQKFSFGFVEALAAKIAAILAYGITRNASFASGIVQYAEDRLKIAKWNDAQEGIGTFIQSGSLLDER